MPERILAILKYWMEVEVHVFGFSIAANVLLSFFPFLIVIVSLFRSMGWTTAEQAIFYSLRDFFSEDLVKHVQLSLSWIVPKKVVFQFSSMFLLLFTANGDAQIGLRALQAGALHYFDRITYLKDELILRLKEIHILRGFDETVLRANKATTLDETTQLLLFCGRV